MEVFGMSWAELTEPFTRPGARPPPFFKGRGPAALTVKEKKDAALAGKEALLDSERKALLSKFHNMTVAEQEQMAKDNPSLFQKVANSEAVEEFLELDFIGGIESSMDCSGICKSALFYWEKDIYHGFPEGTCGIKIIQFFRRAAGPLKAALGLVATALLWIFVLHFALYGKIPKKPAESPDADDLGYGAPQGNRSEVPGTYEMQRVDGEGATPANLEDGGHPAKENQDEVDHVQF